MTNSPGDSFVQFIRSTMHPDDIVRLCAVLLAWMKARSRRGLPDAREAE